MAKADITLARLRELLDYNPATGLFTRRIRRGNNTKAGEVVGSTDKDGYLTVMLDGVVYRLQRLAWIYVHEVWPDGVVDHRNRVRDDNRIDNLRDVPQGTNMQNQLLPRSKTGTGFLGVTRNGGRFQARINVKGRPVQIGTFDTPEEASAAYWAAKGRLHATV